MNKDERRNNYLVFLYGNLFAVIQFTYFFLLEVFLSSRAMPFFVCLFFWLIGFLIGLNLRINKLMICLVMISVCAYYCAFVLIRVYPFQYQVLPLVGLCVAVSGMAPGYFFASAKDRYAHVKKLFLHENNGFILGILISWVSAAFAGQYMLMLAPLLGVVPIIFIAGSNREWV